MGTNRANKISKPLHFRLGNIVSSVFTPVLAKHTTHLSLVDILSVGGPLQRNFEPMRKQVDTWKRTRVPDETAKLVIYRAFVEGELDVPKHLARRVHDLYFNPQIEEFAARTTWSLSNAFTSAFKELDAIPDQGSVSGRQLVQARAPRLRLSPPVSCGKAEG